MEAGNGSVIRAAWLDTLATTAPNVVGTTAPQKPVNDATSTIHMREQTPGAFPPAQVGLTDKFQQLPWSVPGWNTGTDRPAAAAAAGPQPAAPTRAAFYKREWFIQVMVCVGIWVLTFVLLIAIKPPFLICTPKDKLREPEFSLPYAALYALVTMVLAAVCMIALRFATKKGVGKQPAVAPTTNAVPPR